MDGTSALSLFAGGVNIGLAVAAFTLGGMGAGVVFTLLGIINILVGLS